MKMNRLYTVLIILTSFPSIAQNIWYRVDDPGNMSCSFVDTSGNESPIGSHDKLQVNETFSEGMIAINLKGGVLEDDAWGCLNEKGDTIIAGKYLEPFAYINGIAKVAVEHKPHDEGEEDYDLDYYCKYIDGHGNPIIDTMFEDGVSTSMKNNIALCKRGKQWYLLSKNGRLRDLSIDFVTVNGISDGLMMCKRINGYTTYIDTNRLPVLEIPNENYAGNFVNGFAAYSSVKGKYGFMNKEGRPITPSRYDGLSSFSENLCAVLIYDKWGYIDTKGMMVIKPVYEKAERFNNGIALVKTGGKYGFIDKTGKFVIPAKFTNAYSFSNGLAAVADDAGKWGYINAKGTWVIKPQFIQASNFDQYGFTTVYYADEYSDINDPLELYEKALISKNKKIIWRSGSELVIK